MKLDIDKIYNMLSCDNKVSVQESGIVEASKIQSLSVFILPILEENSKSIWGNCAKVLVSKSNEELKPYYNKLFEWFKDMNWPGFDLIYDRLLQVPYSEIETSLSVCLGLAQETNDYVWENTLIIFKHQSRQSGDGSVIDPENN